MGIGLVRVIPGAPPKTADFSLVKAYDVPAIPAALQALIDRLTSAGGTYGLGGGSAIYRRSLVKAVYHTLAAASVLTTHFDQLCLAGPAANCNLLNWISSGVADPANSGGTWDADLGFTVGTDPAYIETNCDLASGITDQKANLSSNGLHFACWITSITTDSDPFVGRVTGNDTLRLNPTSSSGADVGWRIGTGATNTYTYPGTPDPTGFWGMTINTSGGAGACIARLFHNADMVHEVTGLTATTLPGEISIGRNSTTWHAGSCKAWSIGRHLSNEAMEQLYVAMKMMVEGFTA